MINKFLISFPFIFILLTGVLAVDSNNIFKPKDVREYELQILKLKTENEQLKEEIQDLQSLLEIKEFNKIKDTKGLNIDYKVLEKDLQRFNISQTDKNEIIESIKETSGIFNINPLILYAIIETESSFNKNALHSEINIKGETTRAIGLGGIVYEIWGNKLKRAGIIKQKSDLNNIRENILSIGFVFNEFLNMDNIKGFKYQEQSALGRYFGNFSKSYVAKIEKKIYNLVQNEIYTF